MPLPPKTSSPPDAAPFQPAAPRPGKDSPLHCLQCKMAGLRCSLTSKYNMAPAGGPCSRCLRISEPFCMRQDLVGLCTYEPLNPRLANSLAFNARLQELLAVKRARRERENWVLPAWDQEVTRRTVAEMEGEGENWALPVWYQEAAGRTVAEMEGEGENWVLPAWYQETARGTVAETEGEGENWVLPAWYQEDARRTVAEIEGEGAVANDRSMS